MTRKINMLLTLVLLAAAGCATVPTGPSVMVMPAPGKPFDLFQKEDATCRQWASQSVGSSRDLNQNAAQGATIGGIIGAGLGALFTGRPGGMAFGAATGALIGGSQGAEADRYYGDDPQRRYDIAYEQCMYANGNMVPGMRQYRRYLPPPPPPPDLR